MDDSIISNNIAGDGAAGANAAWPGVEGGMAAESGAAAHSPQTVQ
jgi:hypothetical protein